MKIMDNNGQIKAENMRICLKMHARTEVMLKRASKVVHFPLSRRNILFFAQHRAESPPKSGGFEASFGKETSSCARYLQKSFFGNVLPTEGGEHVFIKLATS